MELPVIYFNKSKFVWLLMGYFLIFLIFAIINDRFYSPDFAVYYNAAKNFVSGQMVYNQQYGTSLSGIYKYSPFALFFFIPLTILPEFGARLVYFWFLAGAIIFTLFFLEKFLSQYIFDEVLKNSSPKILFWSFLVCAVHFHRELELGNVNLLLLLLLMTSLLFLVKNREKAAGIVIGIAVMFKPHFVVFLPWLVLRKKGQALLFTGLTLVIGFLLPVIISGWQGNLALHGDWFRTMAEHNSTARLVENPNTLHYWLFLSGARFLIPEPGAGYVYAVILGAGILFLAFMGWNRYRQKDISQRTVMYEFMLLLALVPNITHTDTEHFLLSLPLIMFILLYWTHFRSNRKFLLVITLIGFFFFGGNWYEVWQRSLSIWIEKTGFLGLGNMIIIFSSLYYFSRLSRRADPPREVINNP